MNNCSYCHFRSRYFSLLLRHYRDEHSHQPDFRVKCGIDGCTSTYTVVDSLRKHIIRKHKKCENIDIAQNPIKNEIEQPGFNELVQPEPIDGDEKVSINNKYSDMLEKFLLSMRENHGISEDASALIVKKYSEILSGCISDTKDKFSSHRLPSDIENDILTPLYKLKYSHSCLESVYQECQALKLGKNLRIYAHDRDLGDFFEVDSSVNLPDGGILKVEIDEDCSNDSIRLDDITNYRIPDHLVSVNEGVSEDGSSTEYESSPSKPAPTKETVATDVPTDKSMNETPVEFNMNFNEMPLTLQAALTNKQPLSKSHRTQLLDHLYERLTIQTFYPSRSHYASVCVTLLQAHPYLCSNLDFPDALSLWKERLSMKARNMRRRRDSTVPNVLAKKAATSARGLKQVRSDSVSADGTASNSTKVAQHLIGVKNYLPENLQSEDDSSHQRHIEVLKLEENKEIRDINKINQCMKLTFPQRRQKIVTESISLSEVKEMYPILFDETELLNEFQRLTDIDLEVSLRKAGLEYFDVIVAASGTVVTWSTHDAEEQIHTRNFTIFIDNKVRNHSTDFKIATSLRLVQTLMKEKAPFNTKDGREKVSTPTLIFDEDKTDQSSAELIAEGVRLCRTTTFITSVAAWFASFFVFNYCYPSNSVKTLHFLQRVFVKMPTEGLKSHSLVLSTQHKLNDKIKSL